MLPPVSSIRPPQQIDLGSGSAASSGTGFKNVMQDALNTVNSLQNGASASVQRFLNGEGEELHQVALEQQRASVSFDLFLQVRNKVVSAYQEIMRMQV